jgi:hypothetical protein
MKPKVVGLLAGVLAALVLVGVGAAFRYGSLMPAAATCGSEGEAVTAESDAKAPDAKSPDPVMSVMCERACATKLQYRDHQVVSQPGAKPGDLTRCPVSGVVFVVQQDNPSYAVGGHEWLTCCETCVAKLRKNPERFLTL